MVLVSWFTRDVSAYEHLSQVVRRCKKRDDSQTFNEPLKRLSAFALRNAHYVATIILSVLIAMLPSVATPYPIGHDTAFYVGYSRLFFNIEFVHHFPYLYPFAYTLLSLLYGLGLNMIAFMKIYPIVAYTLLSLSVVMYVRRGLQWSKDVSLLCGIILPLSLAELRIGWDLHSQTLATILFFIALSFLEGSKRKRTIIFLAGLTLAIAFVHLLIAGLLGFVFVVRILLLPAKRLQTSAIATEILLLAILIGGVFLSTWMLVPPQARLLNPAGLVKLANQEVPQYYSQGILWLVSLLTYCFTVHIPLALFGRTRSQTPIILLAFPLLGLTVWLVNPRFLLVFPERYVWLLVYPMTIFSSIGLSRLLNRFRATWKSVALVITALILVLPTSNMMYGAYIPIYQNPPYPVPSSMQWSAVSPSLVGNVLDAGSWFDGHAAPGAVLLTPDGPGGWIYYVTDKSVIRWTIFPSSGSITILANGSLVFLPGLSQESTIVEARSLGFSAVYLLYVEGWDFDPNYNMIEVYRSGAVVLYLMDG